MFWSLTEGREFVDVGFPVSARNHLLGRYVFFSALVVKLSGPRFHNSYPDVAIQFVVSWAWFSRYIDKRFVGCFAPQVERLGC
jgi:hypothetical protein